MPLSTNIKYYRLLSGLSQRAVAFALNVRTNTYQTYESGRAEPSIQTLCALRDLYGLASVEVLIDGTGEPVLTIETKYRRLSARDKSIVDAVLSG